MFHSKGLLPRIATYACLLCTVTLAASAQDATVQADGGLRLRTDASTSASIITTIPNGATIDVVSDGGNGWYQVTYNGETGYSSSEYIQLVDTTTTTVAQLTPLSETPASTTTYIRVTEGPLNIRSGAGTDFDKVGSLSTGAVSEVISFVDGWYEISTGYVSADFVTEVDASALAASSSLGQQIADFAVQYVGCSYSYGGTSPSGFDCSGFVQYVFKNFGISINRTSSAQMSNGTAVSFSELQAGDALYFSKSGGSVSHTGIYIGNGQFVHASTYGVGVIISNMSDAYYTSGFVGARRMA